MYDKIYCSFCQHSCKTCVTFCPHVTCTWQFQFFFTFTIQFFETSPRQTLLLSSVSCLMSLQLLWQPVVKHFWIMVILQLDFNTFSLSTRRQIIMICCWLVRVRLKMNLSRITVYLNSTSQIAFTYLRLNVFLCLLFRSLLFSFVTPLVISLQCRTLRWLPVSFWALVKILMHCII